MADAETSRYVTVFHQLKADDHRDVGERSVVHGEEYDDRFTYDGDTGEFIPTARPIAVIDVGVPITDADVTAWCDSHAGHAALAPYIDGMTPVDPTLPDVEEHVDRDGDADDQYTVSHDTIENWYLAFVSIWECDEDDEDGCHLCPNGYAHAKMCIRETAEFLDTAVDFLEDDREVDA